MGKFDKQLENGSQKQKKHLHPSHPSSTSRKGEASSSPTNAEEDLRKADRAAGKTVQSAATSAAGTAAGTAAAIKGAVFTAVGSGAGAVSAALGSAGSVIGAVSAVFSAAAAVIFSVIAVLILIVAFAVFMLMAWVHETNSYGLTGITTTINITERDDRYTALIDESSYLQTVNDDETVVQAYEEITKPALEVKTGTAASVRSTVLKTGVSLSSGAIDTVSDDSITRLVGSASPLSSDYVPSSLVSLKGAGSVPDWDSNIAAFTEADQLREEAASAFVQMCEEAYSSGIQILPLSGYRSYQTQLSLSSDSMTASAGMSEHQTGLAIDVWTPESGQDTFVSFDQTMAYQWLRTNAHRFGFVLSMPEHAGGLYEPWHWRFIGTEAALDYRTKLELSGDTISIFSYLASLNSEEVFLTESKEDISGEASSASAKDYRILIAEDLSLSLSTDASRQTETAASTDSLIEKLSAAGFQVQKLSSTFSSDEQMVQEIAQSGADLVIEISFTEESGNTGNFTAYWSSFRNDLSGEETPEASRYEKTDYLTGESFLVSTSLSDTAVQSKKLAFFLCDYLVKAGFSEAASKDSQDFLSASSPVPAVRIDGSDFSDTALDALTDAVLACFDLTGEEDYLLMDEYDLLYFICAVDTANGNYAGNLLSQEDSILDTIQSLDSSDETLEELESFSLSSMSYLERLSFLRKKLLAGLLGVNVESYEGYADEENADDQEIFSYPVYEKSYVYLPVDQTDGSVRLKKQEVYLKTGTAESTTPVTLPVYEETELTIASSDDVLELLEGDLFSRTDSALTASDGTEISLLTAKVFLKTDKTETYGSASEISDDSLLSSIRDGVFQSTSGTDYGLRVTSTETVTDTNSKASLLVSLGLQPNAPYENAVFNQTVTTDTITNAQQVEILKQNFLDRYGEYLSEESISYGTSSNWLWPLASQTDPAERASNITSLVGTRNSPGGIGSTNHRGTDIACPEGTPVVAIGNGTVIQAGEYGGYGLAVTVSFGKMNNGKELTVLFGHNSSLSVSVGDTVVQGQQIALSGSTGNSTGAHLHMECWMDSDESDLLGTLWLYPPSMVYGTANTAELEADMIPEDGILQGLAPEDPSKNPYAPADAVLTSENPDVSPGDIESWRPWVEKALIANGLSASEELVSKVLRQIQTESGGDASIVQGIVDSNSSILIDGVHCSGCQAGSNQSRNIGHGLMQTILTTFEAYKHEGHDDIFNGYDNLLAAINYAKTCYGENLDGLGNGTGY